MGLAKWVCRALCSREIRAEAERVRLEQEQQLRELKSRAVRQTCPERVREAATERLLRLVGED